jgi:hypothetical protein
MKKITTYNYEAFYLDYLEGNLSDKRKDMLFEFLNQHPDLKAELELNDDILNYTLPTDFKVILKEKENLKHCDNDEICLKNVDEFIIADIEDQLLPDKKQTLNQFVKQHQLEQKVFAYKSTKLKPNLKEIYPNKKELKHQTKIVPLLIKISAVAALLLLLFNIINLNPTNQNKYQQRQAKYQYKKTNFDENTKNINNKYEGVKHIEQIAKSNPTPSESNETKSNKNTIKTATNDITPKKDFQPNQITEQQPINKKQNIDTTSNTNNDPQVLPFKEENQKNNSNNIASINTKDKTAPNIKLIDMYQPVTQVANNYTSLNVIAKKSPPESEYQVTQIKIGKFSFERKKKK